MKKDLSIIGGLFLVVVVLIIFGNFLGTGGLLSGASVNQASREAIARADTANVTIGELRVKAKVAASEKDRKLGLSKYDSLPLDEGMIFVFGSVDTYAIWMKDMQFAIDIIWVDESKKVVDIAKNVAPEPGKKDSELTIYRPIGEAKYILEVNAGLASLYNIKTGDAVEIEL